MGKQFLGIEDGIVTTSLSTADEYKNDANYQWIMEPNDESHYEGRVTWFSFHIKNAKTGKFLSSTENCFPDCFIDLKDEPVDWSIGTSRVTLMVIGVGNRGFTYARYSGENPDLARVVGLVDP